MNRSPSNFSESNMECVPTLSIVGTAIKGKKIYISRNRDIRELSKTEHAIILLLAIGKTYKEISEINGVCIDTVKKHCSNIYKKLLVGNKTEAINYYRNSMKSLY
jgi:DNA-binding NarL/FixJ family response regulator